MAIESINPANGVVYKKFKEYSDKKCKDILKDVEKAFQSWKNTSFEERAMYMKNAAQILRDKKDYLGKVMAEEMGKPIKEAIGEADKCGWVCEYYAKNAEKILQEEVIKTDASRSYVRFDPIGAVLAVMPWNYPFWQVFRFAAPALMAGNVGVLKHASNVPRCALEIERIFIDAGFPKNVFRTLLIGGSKVNNVIKNPVIKAVTLTGSDYAGRQVAEFSGKMLKKTVLELGGSDPFIVLGDADLKLACEGATLGRFQNTGQSCIAAKRFIVVKQRLKEFEKMYVSLVQSKVMGDQLDPKTDVGPLAREDLAKALDKQVKKSIKMGAKVLIGGKKGKGAFYYPTVLTNVTRGMPVAAEETFGPVAAIISVKDAGEAIEVANDTSFGLGASIWTRDLKKAEELAREIDAGAVFINSIVKSDPRLPFGGVKASGYGRELSHYGIKEFVNIKTVYVK